MSARAARPPMGIATNTTVENKIRYRDFLASFDSGDIANVEQTGSVLFSDASVTNASHPINEGRVRDGYVSDVIKPIFNSFSGLQRQNYIVIGGEYLGHEWVTSTGYFYGHFEKPLLGIPASGKLAYLRFGEFHKVECGQITESFVFLGFAELIIALGLWPLSQSQGYEGVVPGPATHDGVFYGPSDPANSRASADMVEGMLMQLASEDEKWKPYWDERMVWYGPGGLGSYSTIDGFSKFQRPFELIFEGWGGGEEDGITGVGSQCKAGDSEYTFLSGWPQLTGIQVKSFLGVEPTQKRVFMRDCNWWRCENGKILENWCMLDIPHVLLQLGYDLFAEISQSTTSKKSGKEF